jgi:hypothetical protein
MSVNMGYCQFENTYKALREIELRDDNALYEDNKDLELSESEQQYKTKLHNQVKRIYEGLGLGDE